MPRTLPQRPDIRALHVPGAVRHANSHEQILEADDLVNSSDGLAAEKNQPYPVFTGARPDDLAGKKSVRINALFRWTNARDTAAAGETKLFLVKAADLKTSFTVPTAATADVTPRRVRKLEVAPGAAVSWTFGTARADSRGASP